MGSALMFAISKNKYAELFVYDKDEVKALTVAEATGASVVSAAKIAATCDYVFLAVKPNIVPIALSEISKMLVERGDATVVSMAAGVDIASIERAIGSSDVPIIRIMPNTPVSVGEGMILYTVNCRVKNTDEFVAFMSGAGEVDLIDERLIDAASALSGCGPAFVFMFAEALADGAVASGLPRDKALKYAAKTITGAGRLLESSGKHPAELKDAVCSPGGSTIQGVSALEDGGFRSSVMNAVLSAYKRTLELGK